ncbi:signal peptidase II [Clostridium manihotivorum]|uniref:Signal peptidase II n=1 Tax=Clostridium manihotivorum TaxID=2320868 RepID=A0A410DMB4_9CLOT|nr:signal peptidase II [Clostridium manihotivorum]QAA30221.1 signal peptidase II [Clostridium manihotivorum]
MNKDKLLTIGILPIMWLIYFTFEFITGRIHSKFDIIMNLLPVLLFGIIGLIIYYLGIKFSKGLSNITILITFFFTFLLDQGVKLIIKTLYFDKSFFLIDNFLSFNPIINSSGSWLNARFGAGINFSVLIIINAIVLFFILEGYRYYLHKGYKDFWADMSFTFILSGCLCSLIDKIFYGGSLDFIGISSLFIADLKDIYINLSIFFLALCIYNNGFWKNSEETTFKQDIEGVKRFLSFIKKDIFFLSK